MLEVTKTLLRDLVIVKTLKEEPQIDSFRSFTKDENPG